MKSQSRSTQLWGVMVTGLCALWFAAPAGATPLESWDDKIPNASQRFKVLTEFAGEAVLDRETGLVWEKSQDAGLVDWAGATLACLNKETGDRKGWRLPSAPELASLVDPPSAEPAFSLPPGHPFTNVQGGVQWSATTVASFTDSAYVVNFINGFVKTFPKGATIHYWCVRGPMQQSVY